MGEFALKLNRLAIFIWKLIALNFLWLGGTLLGAVVLGIGPATASLCATLRNDLRHENDSVKTSCRYFINYYKKNFKRTLLLFLPVIILSYLLFISNRFYVSTNDSNSLLLRIAIIITLIIMVSLFIYLPSVYAHYHYDELYKYYILSIILIVRRLHITLTVIIVPYLVFVIIDLILPGLNLLMSVSLSYYITNWFIYHDLEKIIKEG